MARSLTPAFLLKEALTFRRMSLISTRTSPLGPLRSLLPRGYKRDPERVSPDLQHRALPVHDMVLGDLTSPECCGAA